MMPETNIRVQNTLLEHTQMYALIEYFSKQMYALIEYFSKPLEGS